MVKGLEWGQTGGRCFPGLCKGISEWHVISCCQKLGNFGISGALFNWCKDYLTDREQRVVIEGMNSTWCAIPSDVPQGSLLGPLFFEIFISDLPEVVMPEDCVSLYADDCKTSRIIKCPADHSVFQSDLDNFSMDGVNKTSWSLKWRNLN